MIYGSLGLLLAERGLRTRIQTMKTTQIPRTLARTVQATRTRLARTRAVKATWIRLATVPSQMTFHSQAAG